jgi:formate dehydrogenase major subunit
MSKLRLNPAERAREFLKEWSIPRQLRGEDPKSSAAQSHGSRQLRPRLEDADKVGTSICPYCAVGCSQLVYVRSGKVIHIEGDPRSPINQGTLCPKGAATFGWLTSETRLTKVRYRAPHSDHWEEKPLEWAMDRIAQLVKRTRDESFVHALPGDGPVVNHTLALAELGGATLDNEENYLIKKLFGGGLGAVWIENQARV